MASSSNIARDMSRLGMGIARSRNSRVLELLIGGRHGRIRLSASQVRTLAERLTEAEAFIRTADKACERPEPTFIDLDKEATLQIGISGRRGALAVELIWCVVLTQVSGIVVPTLRRLRLPAGEIPGFVKVLDEARRLILREARISR